MLEGIHGGSFLENLSKNQLLISGVIPGRFSVSILRLICGRISERVSEKTLRNFSEVIPVIPRRIHEGISWIVSRRIFESTSIRMPAAISQRVSGIVPTRIFDA